MVSETVLGNIDRHLEHIQELPYQLIIIAGPAGSGKTALLQEITRSKGYPLINVNHQLSARLIELSLIQRKLNASQLMIKIVSVAGSGPVLLDNTELLFDTSLKLDPIALLKKISRNRTLIITWSGVVEDNHLKYARQGHPEYGSYDIEDIIIMSPA